MVIQIQWTSVALRSSLLHTPDALPTNASLMDNRWRGRVIYKSETCCDLSFFQIFPAIVKTASGYVKIQFWTEQCGLHRIVWCFCQGAKSWDVKASNLQVPCYTLWRPMAHAQDSVFPKTFPCATIHFQLKSSLYDDPVPRYTVLSRFLRSFFAFTRKLYP